ncbi:MAG: TolC family protein [Bryobacteraceae bacterium]
MRKPHVLIGILVAAAYPPWGLGQESLSLQQAVERALATHPLLAGSAERIAVSQGLRRQAALRQNPRLTLQTENWRPYATGDFQPSRDTDSFVYFSQLFETAGKRELRTDAAAEGVRLTELERDLVSRRIAARVKLAFWRAAVAAKVHQLRLDNVRNFDQIVEFHEIRVREGAMAEADLLRVRLESERLQVEANTAELEADRGRILLLQEMGQTEFPRLVLTDKVEEVRPFVAGDAAQALENRPEILIARQVLNRSLAIEKLRRAESKPDVEASIGYKRTAGFNTMMGIVQVPLPLIHRNQGLIESASAEVRVARSEVAALEALVRAEVAAAAANAAVRRRQVTETFRGLLDKALESSRIAQAAYREGGSDLLRLLDAERSRIEVQVLYYRTLAEYHEAEVTLEMAMGGTP